MKISGNQPQSSQRTQSFDAVFQVWFETGTRMTRRDMKGTPQIAKYATPSIWGNPTVTCVGSNAGV